MVSTSIQDAIALAAQEAPHVPKPIPVEPGLQLHVDGDYLAYYASGNDDTTSGQARNNAISLIAEFKSATGADKVIMQNTAPGCQKGERYLVATVKPYQAQRKSGRKPKNHAYLQDWLQRYDGDLFQPKNWMTREADDGIAACAHYALTQPNKRIVIATADKDMRMLPGIHINWRGRQITEVKPGDYDVVGEDGKQYGLLFFFQQMLMGDTADHIPGLPEYRSGDKYKKLGEKTAIKLLEDCPDVTSAAQQVEDLYYLNYNRDGNIMDDKAEHLEWADRLAEQAALLWMRCGLHATVDDFAAHKGASYIPWSQPVLDAAQRLVERVADARAQINSL